MADLVVPIYPSLSDIVVHGNQVKNLDELKNHFYEFDLWQDTWAAGMINMGFEENGQVYDWNRRLSNGEERITKIEGQIGELPENHVVAYWLANIFENRSEITTELTIRCLVTNAFYYKTIIPPVVESRGFENLVHTGVVVLSQDRLRDRFEFDGMVGNDFYLKVSYVSDVETPEWLDGLELQRDTEEKKLVLFEVPEEVIADDNVTFNWYSSRDGENWELIENADEHELDYTVKNYSVWYRVNIIIDGIPIRTFEALVPGTIKQTDSRVKMKLEYILAIIGGVLAILSLIGICWIIVHKVKQDKLEKERNSLVVE